MTNRWLAALALAGLVLAGSTAARAQDSPITFGVTGGATYAGISTGELEPGTELNYAAGWSAGVFGLVPFTDAASLLSELVYTRKGAREVIRLEHIEHTVRRSYTIHYVEAPLLARLAIADEPPLTPFVAAGAVPALALRARSRVDDMLEDLDDRVRRFDLGLAAGLGADYDTPWGTARLHARYTVGLLDVDRTDLPGVNRNRSLAVMAAFAIGSPF